MKKEDLDKRICDVTNKINMDMTFREYIHDLDHKVYGDFAVTDERLNEMNEAELNELLGRLEFLGND